MHVFKKFLYSTYTRLVIFLFIRGIHLPGINTIKRKMGGSYQKFERQKLIHDIKCAQLHVRTGPIWFRLFFEQMIKFLQQNKFIIMIFLKIGISLTFIAIPIGLFVLLRGVLPVPDRVPYEIPGHKLNATSDLRVDFPYTEENSKNQNIIQNFGIGFLPFKLNIVRGLSVTDEKDATIYSSFRDETSDSNTQDSFLRIGYYLQPSPSSKQVSCILQIFNQKNELLGQITEITPNIETNSKYSIRNSWRKAFTPNIIPSFGYIGETKIPLIKPPEQLILKTFNPNKTTTSRTTSPECNFIVSDFSFEHHVQKPLPRRGVILIIVHSLRTNTAYDRRLMPKLNKYIQNNGMMFLEHRVQSNQSDLSMLALITSQYLTNPKKFFKSEKSETFLPLSLQKLGYRVGAIGAFSTFTDIVSKEDGHDIGLHNAIAAELPRYEARHITELTGQWLEKYGNAPFFLMLYYYGMENPFKPPSEQLNLLQLLQNPFGLNQKKQLYRGLARYFDNELNLLFQKIQTLGILENTDIIITSDHGVQLDQHKWNLLLSNNRSNEVENAAYATSGHSLFDEEIRVPLMIKIAGHKLDQNLKINTPSAQIDLFPTLYGLMGGQSGNINALGLNFAPALLADNTTEEIKDILSQRHTLLINSNEYSGLLAWDIGKISQPVKYIRQLANDEFTLYLTQAPWKKRIQWYKPELFTKIDFNNHSENWSPNLSDDEKNEIRTLYQTIITEYK